MRIVSLRKDLGLIYGFENFDIKCSILYHFSFKQALSFGVQVFKLYLVEINQLNDIEKEDHHAIFRKNLILASHIDVFQALVAFPVLINFGMMCIDLLNTFLYIVLIPSVLILMQKGVFGMKMDLLDDAIQYFEFRYKPFTVLNFILVTSFVNLLIKLILYDCLLFTTLFKLKTSFLRQIIHVFQSSLALCKVAVKC